MLIYKVTKKKKKNNDNFSANNGNNFFLFKRISIVMFIECLFFQMSNKNTINTFSFVIHKISFLTKNNINLKKKKS